MREQAPHHTEDLLDEEPIFPEEAIGLRRRLDFFGRTLPALHRELRRQLHQLFLAARSRSSAEPAARWAWYVAHPAGDEVYGDFPESERGEDLPALVAAAGLSHCTRSDFVARWIDAGVFAPLQPLRLRPEFTAAGLADPLGIYQVYGAGAWVILADLDRLGRRPLPTHWSDLFHPRYRRDITASGEGGLAPELLYHFHHDFGAEGLKALGRNLRAFRGGGRMARMAGTRDPEGTALYLLPRFWAENNIHREKTAIVWPSEGAYATPLYLLGKARASAGARLAFEHLTSARWATAMEGARCLPALAHAGATPLPGALRWFGWETARRLDTLASEAALDALLREGLRA